MNSLPNSVIDYLDRKNRKFIDMRDVEEIGRNIGVKFPKSFIELFSKYEGGWGAPNNYHFLDVIEIVQNAEKAWAAGLPKNLLLISDPAGECWLFLECEKDWVYSVCIDSGYKEMEEGAEPPTWQSFSEFLVDYFHKEEVFSAERKLQGW